MTPEDNMNTPDMLHRLESLEEEVSKSRQYRHERNEHVVKVIDEERKARLELTGDMDSIVESVNKQYKMMEQVMEYLQGSLGYVGLVKDHKMLAEEVREIKEVAKKVREHEKMREDITMLKSWKNGQAMFVAGVVAAVTVAYSVAGAAVYFFFKKQ